MVNLDGRVAVVTGGTRGIGRAIASSLVDAGARVVIASRDEASVRGAVDALQPASGGARVTGVRCDVGNADDCRALIDGTARDLGRLDILINNAGIGRFAPVAELSEEDWRSVLATNLDGVFYCSRAAVPGSPPGRLIRPAHWSGRAPSGPGSAASRDPLDNDKNDKR
jgi:NAD(P)-dependent dehydrogenase (short-subunit alcohol dehydrogenase family)